MNFQDLETSILTTNRMGIVLKKKLETEIKNFDNAVVSIANEWLRIYININKNRIRFQFN